MAASVELTMNEITKSLVKATLDKYPDLSDQIWAKLHYMVNDQCVGKTVVRNSSVVIDSSDNCTRKQIGLRSFVNRRLRKTTQLALDQFDQGLTMERDREGNIYFRSNSDAASCHVVEVMGWREPQQHSLSSAIVIAKGRIEAQSIKVFDMCEYKSHVALELQRQTVDHDKLHQLSIFCISISSIPPAAAAATMDKTDVEDAMLSNWLCIINLSAIDVLTNEKVISDIKAMQHLDLIRLPDAQLRRNWSRQESQQRPEFEEAEERGGEGGKKAAREKHRKLRKTKSDSGAPAGRSYSWMTEEEKSDSRPTRRMFTGHLKKESFLGERKEWSTLTEL